MANTFLTADIITRECLLVLHNKLSFLKGINKQYDSSFANSEAKIGDTLRIRKPPKFTVRSGRTWSQQDMIDTKVNLTINNQRGVDLGFYSDDLTLRIEDFSNRYIQPAMGALASKIEADCIQSAVLSTYNSVVNGTLGTPPTALLTYLNARTKMNQMLAPTENRSLMIDSNSAAVIVDSLKGLFQDSEQIKRQYREGLMGRTGGMDWVEHQLLPFTTVGNKVSSLTVSAQPTDGGNTIVLAGTAASDTFKAGQVFTIAGVYSVNPETRTSTGALQQFVITADVTASTTTTTVTVSPAFQVASPAAAFQNITALPAASAAVTMAVGTANASVMNGLAYQENAFTFATCDLQLPRGVDMAARETHDGIAMRFVRDFDTKNDQWISRVDVMYGFAPLYPEHACRIMY